MKKDESVKFRMVGHDKTVYQSIEYITEVDGYHSFLVIFKNGDAHIFSEPVFPTMDKTLDMLLESINDFKYE